MFFNNCYIAHLCAINKEIAEKVNVYTDSKSDGCHDWDTIYRFVREGHEPFHVPEILYSWRIHPNSTASGVPSVKPYTVTSQYYVLKKQFDFLNKSNDYDLKENRLFINTGMWSIKRTSKIQAKIGIILNKDERNFKELCSKIEKICNIDDFDRIHILVNSISQNESEIIKKTFKNEKIEISNYSLDQLKEFSNKSFDAVFFLSERLVIENNTWINEALSMIQFRDDIVLVNGKIRNKDIYLWCDSYFDKKFNVINPAFGQHLTNGGYYAARICQKTVDVVSNDFWAIKGDFLKQFYSENQEILNLSQFGFELSLFAKKKNKRVVYTPYIEFGFNYQNSSKHYSKFIYNELNFNFSENLQRFYTIPNDIEA